MVQVPHDSVSDAFFGAEEVQALPKLVELFWARRNELLKERQIVARKIRTLPVSFDPSLSLPFGSANIRKAPWEAKRAIRSVGHSPREALDLEDGLAPHWNLRLHRLAPPSLEGASWLRPRGLHLEERNVTVHGRNLPASLFDLYFGLRKRALKDEWVGIVLPKLESSLEARFWSDLLFWMEDHFGLRRSSLEVCIEFETVGGCIEAEEILFELKDRATTVDFDAYDYAFSWLKIFGSDPERLFLESDAGVLDQWTRPIVAYLSALCEKRGLHFVPAPDAVSAYPAAVLTAPPVGHSVPNSDTVVALANRCLEILSALLAGEYPTLLSEFEFTRSMLWQWLRFQIPIGESRLTPERYRALEASGAPGIGLGGARENSARLFHSFLFKDSLADYGVPSFFKHLAATPVLPLSAASASLGAHRA